jgi:hypothetical protein
MQYLAQEGYVVMNLDYRGSRGYGRDFRIDIYRHMGETEIKSAIAAFDVLVKQYKVDRQRIWHLRRKLRRLLHPHGALQVPGGLCRGRRARAGDRLGA